jgi:hypothetical protein
MFILRHTALNWNITNVAAPLMYDKKYTHVIHYELDTTYHRSRSCLGVVPSYMQYSY